jgi:hypothetical protein
MWLAATGDVAAAERLAQDAVIEHKRLPMPFQCARTPLLLGQLQRRRRQKVTATATLFEAQQPLAMPRQVARETADAEVE